MNREISCLSSTTDDSNKTYKNINRNLLVGAIDEKTDLFQYHADNQYNTDPTPLGTPTNKYLQCIFVYRCCAKLDNGYRGVECASMPFSVIKSTIRMEAVNDLDEIIRRFDSIFREEISQEDRYEANPVDGTNWRIRNKASREAGEKILSALLVDIYFVNGTVSGIELVTDYERVASYLKEVLKQSFYRQVFKVYTKRLLNDQITLNNFLSKWVLAESSRYLKAKEEDIQFKGEPISSIAHRSASL